MKKSICALMVLILALSPALQAQELFKLEGQVNTFISDLAQAKQSPKTLDSLGKDAYVQSSALPISGLDPEKFNLALLYLLARYAEKPEEREDLFELIQHVRGQIQGELAVKQAIEDGPSSFLVDGALNYGVFILIGGAIIWKGILSARNPSKALSHEIHETEKTMLKRYTGSGKTLLWTTAVSSAAGAGIGSIEYMLEKNKTHKIDPLLILNIMQAQIACKLSYEALDLLNKYQSTSNISGEQAKIAVNQIDQLIAQSKLLMDQFPQLDHLSMQDFLFQKAMEQLPPETDFQKVRENLKAQGASQNGACSEISLNNVSRTLEDMKIQLALSLPLVDPTLAVPQNRSNAQ